RDARCGGSSSVGRVGRESLGGRGWHPGGGSCPRARGRWAGGARRGGAVRRGFAREGRGYGATARPVPRERDGGGCADGAAGGQPRRGDQRHVRKPRRGGGRCWRIVAAERWRHCRRSGPTRGGGRYR